MGRTKQDPKQRYMKKCIGADRENGCWSWTGIPNFGIDGHTYTYQSAGWLLWHGSRPKHTKIRMTCHNERCANPTHYKLVGTRTETWELEQLAEKRKRPAQGKSSRTQTNYMHKGLTVGGKIIPPWSEENKRD